MLARNASEVTSHACTFVRTGKYQADEAAGRFTTALWTTRRPGGFLRNLGGGAIADDASVTDYQIGGEAWAIGPIGEPWRVDPGSLATLGRASVGGDAPGIDVEPHANYSANDRCWTSFRRHVGLTTSLSAVTRAADGTIKATASFKSPRPYFMHDYFATQNWVVWYLQPVLLRFGRLAMGLASFADGFAGRPDLATLIVACPRSGGDPIIIEAPARFMFHTVNAFEWAEGEIVLDFIGCDDPGIFIGGEPVLRTILQGRDDNHGPPGEYFRYTIDPRQQNLREERLFTGNHEFPVVTDKEAQRPHSVAFSTTANPGCVFHHRLTAFNMRSGACDSFDFGHDTVVSEPIHVPGPDGGWLLAVVALGREGVRPSADPARRGPSQRTGGAGEARPTHSYHHPRIMAG